MTAPDKRDVCGCHRGCTTMPHARWMAGLLIDAAIQADATTPPPPQET